MFVQRVKEKEAELKEAEKEVKINSNASLCFCSFCWSTPTSCFCLSSRSCTRSLTAWRSSIRTRKRSWRIRRSPWTMKSTRSNRKRLRQSSCRTKLSRQGAPPRSKGTKRGKSEYLILYPHTRRLTCSSRLIYVYLAKFSHIFTSFLPCCTFNLLRLLSNLSFVCVFVKGFIHKIEHRSSVRIHMFSV